MSENSNKIKFKTLKSDSINLQKECKRNGVDDQHSEPLKKKAKKCLQGGNSDGLEVKSFATEPGGSSSDAKIKKRKKHRKLLNNLLVPKNLNKPESLSYEKDHSESIDDMKEKTKKKKKRLSDEYRPGMLSELLQIKKYGRLILPWDPSYGLDLTYKVPESFDESVPKLKINPLFDLSKRKKDSTASSTDSGEITTVFVGNLPFETKIIEIKKLFKKCGPIQHVKLRSKEISSKELDTKQKYTTGDGKYMNATLKFKNVKASEAALKMNGKLYKEHRLRVTLAQDKEKSHQHCIFVGNLAFWAQDDDLWKAFEECGDIESVRIVRDERSQKGKGFGYINFKSAGSIEEALKLDGTTVLDRAIRVSKGQTNISSRSNLITVKRRRIKKKTKTKENKSGQ